MNQKEEKWAIFWCDLISPIIFGEIKKGEISKFLKEIAEKEVVFPDGEVKKALPFHFKKETQEIPQGRF